jgi:hypothetical protein
VQRSILRIIIIRGYDRFVTKRDKTKKKSSGIETFGNGRTEKRENCTKKKKR